MPRARASAIPLTLTVLAAGLLAGCGGLETRPGATSVLDLFNTDPSPGQAADMAIDKYDADQRYRGTLLLSTQSYAGESVYQQLFLDNAKDEDAGVRAAATRALGNHGRPEHVPLILERLADEDPTVRQEAARALQRLHNPIAVDPLMRALQGENETDAEVRAEAAIALAQYPDLKVLQRLIATLDDPQLSVNRNAQVALRTLTGQDFGLDRRAWAQWVQDAKSPFAARAPFAYPVFSRTRYWYEYLPFVPRPPNEPQASPAGFAYPGDLAAAPSADSATGNSGDVTPRR